MKPLASPLHIWLDAEEAHPKWIGVPRDEVTTPTPGKVFLAPSWWFTATSPSGDTYVIYYRSYGSAQRNTNKAMIDYRRPAMARIFSSLIQKGWVVGEEFIESAFERRQE